MSVFKDILDAIQSQLRNYVTLTGVNGIPAIDNESIVIRTPSYVEKDRKYDWTLNVQTPGILIIPGRKIRRPPSEGTNESDDVYYPVMIQIVDKSQQQYHEDRVASWLQWNENIAKYLNHNNLRNAVFSEDGYVNRVVVPEHDLEDRHRFIHHDLCVQYLFVEVISREKRDTTGYQ